MARKVFERVKLLAEWQDLVSGEHFQRRPYADRGLGFA